MKTLLFILLSLSIHCYAIEPMDNYYANDVIDAVNQAKERPHHYDYSSTYRYKRTTAQSIELNRLDLNELDETRLDMQGNAVDLIPNPSKEEILSLNDDKNVPAESNNTLTTPQTVIPVNTRYESSYGNHYTNGVMNQGTLVSTPRP
ncbi:MAG: hypothetical protein ACJA1U_002144 [Bermanella sp.]|jgi:hypothetical protein